MSNEIDTMVNELIKAFCQNGQLHEAELATEIAGRSLTQDETDMIVDSCLAKKNLRGAITASWATKASTEVIDRVISACVDDYNGLDAASKVVDNLVVDDLIVMMISSRLFEGAKALTKRLDGRPPLTDDDIKRISDQWAI